MDFNFIGDNIDAVIIDNFYTKEQLDEIMVELKWLTKPSILKDEKYLSSAEDAGVYQTSKHGVFLEDVFSDWKHSALISHGITQFKLDELQSTILGYNSLFKTFFNCTGRNHLVSYYENADYYKSHIDHSVFTVLSWFNTEPKKFTGGDMILRSLDGTKQANIEFRHNRVLVMAGCTPHEVTRIDSSLHGGFSGDGRYCNAVFFGMAPERENSK